MSKHSCANECWLPVVGFEGQYEVSCLGQVRSVDRIVVFCDGRKRFARGRIRKSHPFTDRGYRAVTLCSENHCRPHSVHVLVLTAFVGPPPSGTECLHDNDIADDNRLSNLRWGTRSENLYDMVRNGRHAAANKTHCKRGHILAAPNLVTWQTHSGGRECLTCTKVLVRVRGSKLPRDHFDMPSMFDEYYRIIMKASV
jgi:hypothetical protein